MTRVLHTVASATTAEGDAVADNGIMPSGCVAGLCSCDAIESNWDAALTFVRDDVIRAVSVKMGGNAWSQRRVTHWLQNTSARGFVVPVLA